MLEKEHNIFYKTINLVNGKFYFGIHSTNKLEDGYLGSGYTIVESIKKHGRKNFVKEIIADYPTRKEASEHEATVVTLEMIEDEMCYNLQTGGLNSFIPSLEVRQKISKGRIGKKLSEEYRKQKSERSKGENNSFYGKHHTEETKQLIREANSGESAPNFGKHFTEEHKKAIGDSQRGKFVSEESRQRMSISQTGKKQSEQQKQKARVFFTKSNPNSRKCIVNNIEFISVAEVSRHFDISYSVVTKRLSSVHEDWIEWKYIDQSKVSEKTRQKSRETHVMRKTKQNIEEPCLKRSVSDETRKILSEKSSGENNAFFGKAHPPELLKQMLLNNPQRKPCIINGIEFLTKISAKNHYEISNSDLNYRLESPEEEWSNWNYLK